MKQLALTVLVALSLASCGGSPQGLKPIGSGRDDMKQSPCACGPEIIQPEHRHVVL